MDLEADEWNLAKHRRDWKKLNSDSELFVLFQLAEALKKTVSEILEISEDEFKGWIAYFNLKNKRERSDYSRNPRNR